MLQDEIRQDVTDEMIIDSQYQQAVQEVRADGLIPQQHGGALRPPVRPGEESRNPGGLVKGQHSFPSRWIGALADLPDCELYEIVGDERASRSKRAAAQFWVDTRDANPDVRRKAYVMLVERIEGKALSRNELSGPDGGPIPHAVAVKHVWCERTAIPAESVNEILR